jgi:hypothetical protein
LGGEFLLLAGGEYRTSNPDAGKFQLKGLIFKK